MPCTCMSVSNTNIPPTSGPDISDKIHPILNNVQPRIYQSLLQNITLPKASQTQSPIQSPVPQSSTSATSSLALPNYSTASQQPFTWGNLTGPEFTKLLDTVYEEELHWRHNCYSVPNGKVGRDFINELSRIYLAYGAATALESIALKAAIVFPILLLKKTKQAVKVKRAH